jgi:protein-arginine deiminase
MKTRPRGAKLRFVRSRSAIALFLVAAAGCNADKVAVDGGDADAGPQPPALVVDLLADVNRNGSIDFGDPTEEQDKLGWDATHGAIFLANIDDDLRACPLTDSNGQPLDDYALPKCNDAADTVINGPDDLLDLARLKTKPWPEAPDDATGTLTVAGGAIFVHVFKNVGGDFQYFPVDGTQTLSAADLRAGVEFGIEAIDIVRDPNVWAGYSTLTLTVTAPSARPTQGSDSVRLRVAPVVTFHHLLDAETTYTTSIAGDPDSAAFNTAMQTLTRQVGVPNPLDSLTVKSDDQWTQDFFETGYMSMPAIGGGGVQHVIRVAYRSANLFYQDPNPRNPLRSAGQVVFTQFRGKDSAGIQQFDTASDPMMDSLNSFGNLETIPPYSLGGVDYPLGRLFRGDISTWHPDLAFEKMLEAQSVQPPVYMDTSWLAVGHVDETISFIKAATPRGWILLANDPALAKQILEDQVAKGYGSAIMFQGLYWLDNNFQPVPADRSISDVLADTAIMAQSATAAAAVDGQLATLKAATGITDQEIVRVPFLHESAGGASLAYQVGTVNSIVPNGTDILVPEPHGPEIVGGLNAAPAPDAGAWPDAGATPPPTDIFKEQLEEALAPHGITVHWVEDWNLYHRLEGEIHCGSNNARHIPSVKWWETGR